MEPETTLKQLQSLVNRARQQHDMGTVQRMLREMQTILKHAAAGSAVERVRS